MAGDGAGMLMVGWMAMGGGMNGDGGGTVMVGRGMVGWIVRGRGGVGWGGAGRAGKRSHSTYALTFSKLAWVAGGHTGQTPRETSPCVWHALIYPSHLGALPARQPQAMGCGLLGGREGGREEVGGRYA